MSRIEEALRRSGRDTTAAVDRTGVEDETPWAFPVDRVRSAEPPTPASVAVRALIGDEGPLTGFNPEWAERLTISPNVNPMLTEQFRRLAASLHHAQTADNTKVIMVTSAWAGDGKTLTALNLALVLSESYRRRVLLVDADLRRPSISNVARTSPGSGLSEGLKASAEHKLAVIRVTETLTLLPAGHPDPDPMSSLTSERMRRIIEEAASRFDWVVLDSPPVGPVADANLLAAMTDAVLLVVRANQTQYAPVQKAIESLGRERIFGVVLNAVDEVSQSQYDQQVRIWKLRHARGQQTVNRQRAAVMSLLLLAASGGPALAQAPRPAEPQPARPANAVFGGTPAARQDMLGLDISLYGAYDQEFSDDGNQSNEGVAAGGPFSGLDLDLSGTRQRSVDE